MRLIKRKGIPSYVEGKTSRESTEELVSFSGSSWIAEKYQGSTCTLLFDTDTKALCLLPQLQITFVDLVSSIADVWEQLYI